jgi:hypothetical protein
VKGIEPFSKVSELSQDQSSAVCDGSDCTQIRTQITGAPGRDLLRVAAAWPELSGPLKAAILAIVGSAGCASALSINRGSESASGAKVAADRAAERQSSDAGAKPEQPICGQGTAPITEDFGRDDFRLAPLRENPKHRRKT